MSQSSSSSNGNVIIAIVLTASITLIIASIFFFFFCHRCAKRRHRNKTGSNYQHGALVTEEFRQEYIYVNKYRIRSSKINLKSSGDEEQLKAHFTTEHINFKSNEIAPSLPSKKIPQPPEATKPPPPPPPPPPTPPPVPPLPALPPPKKRTLPPPPPPMASRPPRATNKPQSSTPETSKGTNFGQTRLKPLHWDKVIANADHSMVWNEILDGSLRFDDDQIELLFGYKQTDRRTTTGNSVLSSPSPQVFILEPRKSQNTAIVLKSIPISRDEILDCLIEGHSLATDILEKLARIAPTMDEQSRILQFSGDINMLANAEGFLYYILKELPSAFVRINAMLFRSNYDSEILHFKQSLQTLEQACKELRTRGLFLKLLEAILKAGNRMNAGTPRGNAQGFNLTGLRKLSDVKSVDGKTTLLHFVVEQVARSEGRRSLINQKTGLEEKECLLRGLQALQGLSGEFSSVKRAAAIEFDSFSNTCSSLATHVGEIQLLIENCRDGNGGKFLGEMKGFVEECKEELKVVEEEQTRILELVKRTTKYYQAGGIKQESSSLQLFAIVKDFLDMVDKVCIDISKTVKINNVVASPESKALPLKPMISPVRFPDLLHLTPPDSSNAPSFSESDNDS